MDSGPGANAPSRNDSMEIGANRLPLVEHEKSAGRDQREAKALTPGDRLLQIDERKDREDQEVITSCMVFSWAAL